MKKRIGLILCLLVLFVGSSCISVFANENTEIDVEVQVFDNLTKEKLNFEIIEQEYTVREIENNTRSADVSFYEAEINTLIKLPSNSGNGSRLSAGAHNEDHYVRSILTVTYALRGGDEIQVQGVSGSWSGLATTYSMIFSNNEVWLFDGVPGGNCLERYPNTSSFSYSTSWGFVTKYPVASGMDAGARAFSSTLATVSGMGGGYVIDTYVQVP